MSTSQKPATKGKSPYVKYQKRPYLYSDELNNWTAAIKKGDKKTADRFDTQWKQKFAPQALYRPRRDDEVDFIENAHLDMIRGAPYDRQHID